MNYTNFSINALVSTGSSSQILTKTASNQDKVSEARLSFCSPMSSSSSNSKGVNQTGSVVNLSPLDYRGFPSSSLNSAQNQTMPNGAGLPAAISLIRANSSNMNTISWPSSSPLIHSPSQRIYTAQSLSSQNSAKAFSGGYFKQHGVATRSAASTSIEHPLDLFGQQAIQRIQSNMTNQQSGSTLHQSMILQPTLPSSSSLKLSASASQSNYSQQRRDDLPDKPQFNDPQLDLSHHNESTLRDDQYIGLSNSPNKSVCAQDNRSLTDDLNSSSNRLGYSKRHSVIQKCGDESNNESLASHRSENGEDDEDDEDEDSHRRRSRKTKIPKTVSASQVVK